MPGYKSSAAWMFLARTLDREAVSRTVWFAVGFFGSALGLGVLLAGRKVDRVVATIVLMAACQGILAVCEYLLSLRGRASRWTCDPSGTGLSCLRASLRCRWWCWRWYCWGVGWRLGD